MKNLTLIIILISGNTLLAQDILFSENKNGNWDIYSINVKDNSINRITSDSLKDFQSDYDHHRNEVVFDSYMDDNTRNIFTLNLKSGELNQLTDLDTRDGHPVWSPDGKYIAFQSSRTGNPEVFIMDYLGQNVKQLTFNESFDGIPKWSPDGKWLAFNSNRDGSPNVFLLNIKTSNLVQITSDEHYNFIQDWLTASDLLIISDSLDKRQLFSIGINKEGKTQLSSDGNVTYARSNKKGDIVFTQINSKDETEVFIMKYDTHEIIQLTHSKGEKKFPVFIQNNHE